MIAASFSCTASESEKHCCSKERNPPETGCDALTKADNLGLGLVILGLLPWANGMLAGLKLIFIWLLVQFAGATVAQLIARAVRHEETQT
jgi:multisubunit Na+/H+ antiporter MnhG subunit